jgi:thiamine biosynthesis protein ThiS
LTCRAQRIAVEHNLEIVLEGALGRDECWHDGDRLEIVHFVGGG